METHWELENKRVSGYPVVFCSGMGLSVAKTGQILIECKLR